MSAHVQLKIISDGLWTEQCATTIADDGDQAFQKWQLDAAVMHLQQREPQFLLKLRVWLAAVCHRAQHHTDTYSIVIAYEGPVNNPKL